MLPSIYISILFLISISTIFTFTHTIVLVFNSQSYADNSTDNKKKDIINNFAILKNTDTDLPITNTSSASTIPTAKSVYQFETIALPILVKSFLWYLVDESHENSISEKHKYISDHNSLLLPTSIKIPQGTSITFFNADAPWDSPHPHAIKIKDYSGKTVYNTGKLDYTNSSIPIILPTGNYYVIDTKYNWIKGNIIVSANQKTAGDLVVGGFYTPTHPVKNNKDNDGGIHPGWLGYYKSEFPKNGLDVLSAFNFHYGICENCPGKYWPDQKTADHTLLIYSTDKSLANVLKILTKFVWNNAYT